MDVMSRLVPLIRDVLNNDRLVITLESNAETLEGYDSLAHINVISAIEQEFGLRFEFAELVDLERVGDMVTLIQAKLRSALLQGLPGVVA
jgi:acyl carrier protein